MVDATLSPWEPFKSKCACCQHLNETWKQKRRKLNCASPFSPSLNYQSNCCCRIWTVVSIRSKFHWIISNNFFFQLLLCMVLFLSSVKLNTIEGNSCVNAIYQTKSKIVQPFNDFHIVSLIAFRNTICEVEKSRKCRNESVLQFLVIEIFNAYAPNWCHDIQLHLVHQKY